MTIILRTGLLLACLAAPAVAQPAPDDLQKFHAKTARQLAEGFFKNPPFELVVIQRLIELGDSTVRPTLVTAFSRETDATNKLFLAAALVSFHDPSPQYYEFVSGAALVAVENDMPFPRPGRPNDAKLLKDEFNAWEHGKTPEQISAVTSRGLFGDSLALRAIGEADDSRAIAILRNGLSSPNFMTAGLSAAGLARLQDYESIPMIIRSCERFTPGPASVIARYLAYFNSPLAKAALWRFVPNAIERDRVVKSAALRGPIGAVFDN